MKQPVCRRAALIVTLSGFPQAALAVVSCQDTINPNTSIRYSDALVSFKAYNGRTYAVDKSAATGGIDFPDGVLKALLVGADAVEVASALYRHGVDHVRPLLDGIRWTIENVCVAAITQPTRTSIGEVNV